MRLFLAFPVDRATREALSVNLENWEKTYRGCSWVPSENLHMTVKFMGDVSPTSRIDIESIVQDNMAGAPAFTLSPAGSGCFPNPRRMKVLFVAYTVPDWLPGWVKKLDKALESVGLKKDKKKFHPHVTLARIRKQVPARIAEKMLKEVGKVELPDVPVRSLRLMESNLSEEKAQYEVLRSFPLEGTYD